MSSKPAPRPGISEEGDPEQFEVGFWNLHRYQASVLAGVDGRRDDEGMGHRCDDDIEESRAGAAGR